LSNQTMTVALHPRADSPAVTRVSQTRTHAEAKTPTSAPTVLLWSALTGFVLVWSISTILVAQMSVGFGPAIAFGAMVGFWIGLGGGLIAGGAVLSLREEQIGPVPTTPRRPPSR
jgi:hypothetical protein